MVERAVAVAGIGLPAAVGACGPDASDGVPKVDSERSDASGSEGGSDGGSEPSGGAGDDTGRMVEDRDGGGTGDDGSGYSCSEVCDRLYDQCEVFLLYHDGEKVPKSGCVDACEWGYFIGERACTMNEQCDEEALNTCINPTPETPDLSGLEPASTWPETWRDYEKQVFALVNLHRQRGVTCSGTDYDPAPPLTWDTTVRNAARSHSLDMARNDIYGHRGSDGSLPGQRLAEAGCDDCQGAGEAINRTFGTPFEAVRSWVGSESHCKRMVDPDTGYTHMGAGYTRAPGAQYEHYWTINYTTR